MKKISLSIFTVLSILIYLKNNSYSSHREILDASNLISGILPNQRVDSSSVTLRGQLSDSSQILLLSSSSFSGTVTSTSGFIGNGSGLTNVLTNSLSGGASTYASFNAVVLATASILSGGASVYIRALPQVIFSTAIAANTIQGENISSQTIVYLTSATIFGTITSTTGFVGDAKGLTNIPLSPRAYTIIIGTSNSGTNNNVDIATNTEEAFARAYANLGANGGSIYVRRGFYSLKGVTVPANVEIIFESSAVVRNNGNFTIFDVSGTIRNLQLETNMEVTIPMVKLHNNSRLINTKNIFILNGISGFTNTGIYEILETSNVVIDNMEDFNFINNSISGSARIFIKNSSNVIINQIIQYNPELKSDGTNGDNTNISILLTGNVGNIIIKNSKFVTSGEVLRANNSMQRLENFIFRDNEVTVFKHDAIGQLFNFAGVGISSNGITMENINIYVDKIAGSLQHVSNVASGHQGTVWNNIIVFKNVLTSPPVIDTFLRFDLDSGRSKIINCNMSYVTDFLIGAAKRGANNYLNAIRQPDDN